MLGGRSSAPALRVRRAGQGDNNCPSEGCYNCCKRCSTQGTETSALLGVKSYRKGLITLRLCFPHWHKTHLFLYAEARETF